MTDYEWAQVYSYILQFEQEGLVTRTFRRLDTAQQQVIIQAILDEAIAKGPTQLNIKQVAERAGVSVGSLYTYFRSREGVLNFAIEMCVRLVTGAMEEYGPVIAAMPLREALATYLSSGVEWSRTLAGLLTFFARAAYHGDPALTDRVVTPVANSMREAVQKILTQAAARGEIRPDLDMEATVRVVNTLLVAVGDAQLLPYLNNYFQVTGGDVSPEQVQAALIELILHGIGAPGGKE